MVCRLGATLTGKDRVIFDTRLVAEEPRTLQEIGDEYGISRERVRQLEARVKKRLRASLYSLPAQIGMRSPTRRGQVAAAANRPTLRSGKADYISPWGYFESRKVDALCYMVGNSLQKH